MADESTPNTKWTDAEGIERAKRARNLESAHFFPSEVEAFSKNDYTQLPYFNDLFSARTKIYLHSKKLHESQIGYRNRVRQWYIDHGYFTTTDDNKKKVDPWLAWTDYRSKWKDSNPGKDPSPIGPVAKKSDMDRTIRMIRDQFKTT